MTLDPNGITERLGFGAIALPRKGAVFRTVAMAFTAIPTGRDAPEFAKLAQVHQG